MPPPDEPMNRRRFFRVGLRELLKPVAQAVDTAAEVAKQVGKIESPDALTSPPAEPGPSSRQAVPSIRPPEGATASRGRNRYGSTAPTEAPQAPAAPSPLRPPGAIADSLMLQTCGRTGECVRACPAQCIKLDAGVASGLPRIDVDAMPCVVCDGLYCMYACPTGALVPTPLADIDMGTAVWRQSLCLRTHDQDCRICIDECPIGNVAIELVDGRVNVIESGCIGCGVCENRCPTKPKSIVVVPKPTA